MIGNTETDIKIGGDFNPVPEDKYTVQIADVSLNSQFNKFKQEDQELLNYQFIILDDKKDADGETTRDRYLWKRMSQIISKRSWLGKFVTALYGRELTREELEVFADNPDSVIGQQICVMTENNEGSNGVVYSNIIKFSHADTKLELVDFKPQQSEKEVESTSVKAVDTPDVQPEGSLKLEDAFSSREKAEKAELEELEEFRAAKVAKEKAAKAKKAKKK